ncbi:serine/threonine protein kinase 2, CTR2 [Pelomyxa schiedti]|nr:serine/threonine protein kinase 2, CTR2 [Pelomyxa schiedti]
MGTTPSRGDAHDRLGSLQAVTSSTTSLSVGLCVRQLAVSPVFGFSASPAPASPIIAQSPPPSPLSVSTDSAVLSVSDAAPEAPEATTAPHPGTSLNPQRRGQRCALVGCALSEDELMSCTIEACGVALTNVGPTRTTSTIVQSPKQVKAGRVTCVSFSHDGSLLACGPGIQYSKVPVVSVHSAPTSERSTLTFPTLCTLDHDSSCEWIHTCTFFPPSRSFEPQLLATGCQSGSIWVWSISDRLPRAGHLCCLKTPSSTNSVFPVVACDSSSNSRLASACSMAGIVLWDVERCSVLFTTTTPSLLGSSDIHSALWCRFCGVSGNLIAAAYAAESSVGLWDVRLEGEASGPSLVLHHTKDVNCCVPSPSDSMRIASVCQDGGILLWDCRSPAEPLIHVQCPDGAATCCEFGPTGNDLFTGASSVIRHWNVEDLQPYFRDNTTIMPSKEQPERAASPEREVIDSAANMSVLLPGKLLSKSACNVLVKAGETEIKRNEESLAIFQNQDIVSIDNTGKCLCVSTKQAKTYTISGPEAKLLAIQQALEYAQTIQARLAIEKHLHTHSRMWQSSDFELVNTGSAIEGRTVSAEQRNLTGVKVAMELFLRQYASRRGQIIVHARDGDTVQGKKRSYFSKNNGLYMVTEFIDGGDLTRYLYDLNFSLTIPHTICLARNIAMGMAYLHDELDVIHRDLKPANVLVQNWNSGSIKICDFGIARGLGSADKKTAMLGTIGYSAPELGADHYTHLIDVFSYAMILLEMSTRAIVWKSFAQLDILKFLSNEQRPDIPPHTPQWQRDLICQCWSQDPTNRPPFRVIVHTLSNLGSPTVIPRLQIDQSEGSTSTAALSSTSCTTTTATNQTAVTTVSPSPPLSAHTSTSASSALFVTPSPPISPRGVQSQTQTQRASSLPDETPIITLLQLVVTKPGPSSATTPPQKALNTSQHKQISNWESLLSSNAIDCVGDLRLASDYTWTVIGLPLGVVDKLRRALELPPLQQVSHTSNSVNTNM